MIRYEPNGRTVLITLDGETDLNLGAVGASCTSASPSIATTTSCGAR